MPRQLTSQCQPQLHNPSRHCNSRQGLILQGHVQLAPKPQLRERRCDGPSGKGWSVAALAEMCQYDDRKPGMVQLGEKLARGAVGEVAGRSCDPALHHRRIVAGPQLHFIVIGFQHQRVYLSQEITNPGGHPPEIIRDAYPNAVAGLHHNRERLSRIVTGRAGFDIEWPKGSAGAQPDGSVLDRAAAGCDPLPGSGGSEHRDAEPPSQTGGTVCVIAVLMGEHDPSDLVEHEPGALRPSFDFPRAESGIDEHGHAVGLHREAVTSRS